MMEPRRKLWNQGQQELRKALSHPAEFEKAVRLFLDQHAMVHPAGISRSGLWSFEDAVWEGLGEEAARCVPAKFEHSIAWLTWHMARIEDVTMNILVADGQQVLEVGGWLEHMKVSDRDTGNALDPDEITRLSKQVDLQALRNYRRAVGLRTREIVGQLRAEQLGRKVEASRLERIMAEGAVNETSRGLIDYWGGLTIAGLLLMPPTRHNFVHLNEASRLKPKCK